MALSSETDAEQRQPQPSEPVLSIAKGTVRHTLAATHPVVARIMPGQRIRVETELNIGDHLHGLDDVFDISMATAPFLNGSTGPIHVRGAAAGDAVVVEIEQMELIPPGFSAIAPGLWPFVDHAHPPGTPTPHRIVDVDDGCVIWDEDRRIPVRPMVGVLGTAPAFEAISTMDCGRHGGNLDVQEFGPGTRIFLPAAVDGALLYVGDCHAVQGDGELCGFGAIEIRSHVTMRVDVMPRPAQMQWPRFENESHIGTVACGRPLEDAFRAAVKEMVNWLTSDFAFSVADAVLLLGQVAEARCTQLVNPHFTYVCKVAKTYLGTESGGL
jgi:amidase